MSTIAAALRPILLAAHVQGGPPKALDFAGAVAEMQQAGLAGAFVMVAQADLAARR